MFGIFDKIKDAHNRTFPAGIFERRRKDVSKSTSSISDLKFEESGTVDGSFPNSPNSSASKKKSRKIARFFEYFHQVANKHSIMKDYDDNRNNNTESYDNTFNNDRIQNSFRPRKYKNRKSENFNIFEELRSDLLPSTFKDSSSRTSGSKTSGSKTSGFKTSTPSKEKSTKSINKQLSSKPKSVRKGSKSDSNLLLIKKSSKNSIAMGLNSLFRNRSENDNLENCLYGSYGEGLISRNFVEDHLEIDTSKEFLYSNENPKWSNLRKSYSVDQSTSSSSSEEVLEKSINFSTDGDEEVVEGVFSPDNSYVITMYV